MPIATPTIKSVLGGVLVLSSVLDVLVATAAASPPALSLQLSQSTGQVSVTFTCPDSISEPHDTAPQATHSAGSSTPLHVCDAPPTFPAIGAGAVVVVGAMAVSVDIVVDGVVDVIVGVVPVVVVVLTDVAATVVEAVVVGVEVPVVNDGVVVMVDVGVLVTVVDSIPVS